MSVESENLARNLLSFGIAYSGGEKRGWKVKFARDLGVSPQQLSDMLNGRQGIGDVTQRRLIALGCNIHWLLTGIGSMTDPEERPFVRMVREAIHEPGGTMQALAVEPSYTYIPLSVANPDEIRAIAVPDDSMAGVVWSGDTVFIRKTQGCGRGDLCLVHTAVGGYKIRHVYIKSDTVLLTATNAEPENLPLSDLVSVHSVIAATVEGIHLRGK